MRIRYTRVSTLDQHTDRQKLDESGFDLLVEDKCSGAIPFEERNGGKQILEYLEKDLITELSVHQLDRLGRNLRNILNVIHRFTEKGVCINFTSQGLKTIDDDGKPNPIATMVISILGVVGEMERNLILERTKSGIQIAKAKGKYLGRKSGSSESTLDFLSKPKNKKALDLLKKGYKAVEVSQIIGIHPNTVTKIRKLGLSR
jgi:DNA invertase Pin-like site-specific DNA recombinase